MNSKCYTALVESHVILMKLHAAFCLSNIDKLFLIWQESNSM